MPKTLCTALALILATCGFASAAPHDLKPDAQAPIVHAPIVLAANGCGRGMFRTIDGECLPNLRERVGPGRVIAPPPCPRGYLRDPDPARPLCYPAY